MTSVDLGIWSQALLGDESECGDLAFVKKYDNQYFIALIDVLGHGKQAREVAIYARDYLKLVYHKDLTEIMLGLHQHLKGTRGAVAAVCNLDISSGKFSYVGIGNITIRIFGAKPARLISKDGIVGYRISKPRKNVIDLHSSDVILLYSDGVKEHFESYECKGLLKENAEDIAFGIIKLFGKKNDDAICVALKYFK